MKKVFHLLTLSIVLSIFSSCASIVSKSNWPVHVASDPAGATVTITNRAGHQVFKGTTPTMLSLKSGAGFFKKESYTVQFEIDGYVTQEVPLQCKVNGWYWGNIVFGGLIGWLIIDPATGAMYKLEVPVVDARLSKNASAKADEQPALKISVIKDLPQSMLKDLVRIK